MRERGKQLLDDLWRRLRGLSAAQRLALLILGMVAFSALGAALLGGTGEVLGGGSSERQGSTAAARESPRPAFERALELARDEAALSDSADVVSWLYEGSGWLDFDSPQRFEAKLLQSRCKLIEESIRWNGSIQRAVIAVHRGTGPRFARDKAPADSAAVVLRLDDGCERLPEAEARAIRSLVAGAFNLAPQSVAVVDHRLHCYEARALPFPWEEDEDRLARKIESEIAGILSKSFSRGEFAVAAIVHLSWRSSRLVKEEYDPERAVRSQRVVESTRDTPGPPALPGGIIASSSPQVTIERSEEVRASVERLEEDIPAGEVLGVRVNVLLDLDAVRRLAASSSPAGAGQADAARRERELIAEHEGFIRKLLPYRGSEVAILAQPFVRPEEPPAPPSIAVAPPGGQAAAAPATAGHPDSGGGWPAPLAGAASVLASGILLLAALRMSRRRRRALEEPAARGEEVGARGAEAATRSSSRQRPGLDSGNGRGPALTPEGFAGMDDLSGSVRERPEVAASVLRLWLAQDFEAREEALA